MTPEETYERISKKSNAPLWESMGLLTSTDPHIRLATALMLENQRLINRRDENEVPQSLAIVAKIMQNLLAHKIVSVQPKLGPISPIYTIRSDGSLFSDDSVAKTRKLKESASDEIDVDYLAGKIVDEIDSEITTDLWNHAGTVIKTTREMARDYLGKLSATMNLYRHGRPTKKWMVVREDEFNDHRDFYDSCVNYPRP